MTKTKVNTSAFRMSLGPHVSFDELRATIISEESSEIRANGFGNQVLMDVREGYLIGLILTFKGDKLILGTKGQQRDIKATRLSLRKNERSTQVSLFCLHPVDGMGMLYTYHTGLSTNSFGNVMECYYKKILREKRATKKLELLGGKKRLSESKKKRLEEYSANLFSLTDIISNYDIDQLIQNFSVLHQAEFNIAPSVQPTSVFSPLKNFAQSIRTSINIDKENQEGIRTAIKQIYLNLVEKDSYRAMRLYGKTLSGKTTNQSLGENLRHFGQIYLDDFIDLLPKDKWRDYTTSLACDRLINTVKEHPDIIERPPSVESWKKIVTVKDKVS